MARYNVGMTDHQPTKTLLPATLAALGIVYGDIGTSPLYAIRACFIGDGRLAVNEVNVLGVLSLIFWSLALVVSLKYLVFVMRADNQGEGGILALMSLITNPTRKRATAQDEPCLRVKFVVLFGLFGASLLYGDGIITPAISVLSAIEGVHVATGALDHLVLPTSLLILFALFWFQKRGTAKIGRLFGPAMIVWFAVIAVLGIAAIVKQPSALAAVNPIHAIVFFRVEGFAAFTILGVVFLVVTGGEALYADMGHFGKRPIRLAWFMIVLPSLLLNYFGQGALLLSDAATVSNPFYLLAPSWALIPMVLLATIATVIASQAIISGAFSLTSQAVQLGYLPRVSIIHTSKDEQGQIYVPVVNWLMFAGVVALVLSFRTSENLAAAYGMAVTTTMVITSVLLYLVAVNRWQWSRWFAVPLIGLFLCIDVAFFAANLPKIPDGGWLPLLVGVGLCVVMMTWNRGRQTVLRLLRRRLISTKELIDEMATSSPRRLNATAIYLTSHDEGVPMAMLHNVRHNQAMHNPVGLLTIDVEDRPWVSLEERLQIERIDSGWYRIVAHYGFKQRPNLPGIVEQCRQQCVDFGDPSAITYFLSRVTLDIGNQPTMLHWRKLLFVALLRNADDPSKYFHAPPDQVVEIGTRLEI
ncbi:potassium transporter Kup [Rubripirellula reticaptiva]|nr:potassium transporter Kup [Rubripirellula reticaptiva]